MKIIRFIFLFNVAFFIVAFLFTSLSFAGTNSRESKIEISCFDIVEIINSSINYGNVELVIYFGEILLENKYKEKTLFTAMARSYYVKNELNKSIEMLKLGLSVSSYCYERSNEKLINYDNAIINLYLSEIYGDLNKNKKAKKYFNEAKKLINKSRKDKYDDDKLVELFNKYSLKAYKSKASKNRERLIF